MRLHVAAEDKMRVIEPIIKGIKTIPEVSRECPYSRGAIRCWVIRFKKGGKKDLADRLTGFRHSRGCQATTWDEYRWIHPETRAGEVYIGNMTKEAFARLYSDTKRRGLVPYNLRHKKINRRALRPVFVKKEERARKDIFRYLFCNHARTA